MPLADLLVYWRAVEASTLEYLKTLDAQERAREVVMPRPEGDERFTVEHLLWHVLQHEVRHTAQIALLTRQAGYVPPQLDLLVYLTPR
ncbi:putative damage-inducible protein DinB [Deinobacterium chartae]|uniref:Putative damage-inducible protein DinB n=1 Tax=Deinobacterium chartae TaxID=521158 RepID=A0A841HX42_9DEIO|nr:putative damage-inducible protein DinB [Deinobacterium chartae]